MKITLNPDEEIVRIVKEGLEKTGGYCPCRREHTEDTKCMCKEFKDQIKDPSFEGFCHCMLYYKSLEDDVKEEAPLSREEKLSRLFKGFSEDYTKMDAGKKIRPRLGNSMPLHYMRERQTLMFATHPELKQVGYEIGYMIGVDITSDMIKGKTLPEIMESNQPLAEEINYAIEEVVEADEHHAIYRHYECADCYGLPNIHDKICVYEAGVAAGMFSTALGKPVRVREIKCCCNGDPYCEFLVETD